MIIKTYPLILESFWIVLVIKQSLDTNNWDPFQY